MDRLVDRVRAGVDGGNNNDEPSVGVSGRLGEPWDGDGGRLGGQMRQSHGLPDLSNLGHRHHSQGYNLNGGGSGNGGIVEEIGGE